MRLLLISSPRLETKGLLPATHALHRIDPSSNVFKTALQSALETSLEPLKNSAPAGGTLTDSSVCGDKMFSSLLGCVKVCIRFSGAEMSPELPETPFESF